MTKPAEADVERETPKVSRSAGNANFIVKVIIVGMVDALLIACLAQVWSAEWWLAVAFFVLTLVAFNYVYFSGRTMPLKYLFPGLVFLIVFQLYIMVFTAYTSFTNYGTSHLLTNSAESAAAIQQASVVPIEGAPQYPVVAIVKDNVVSMLVDDEAKNQVSIGTNEGLEPVSDSELQRDGDKVTGVAGYESLNLATMSGNADYQAQWDELRPPYDEAAGIFLRPISITRAAQAQSGFAFDEAKGTMTSTEGVVYTANSEKGAFLNEKGEKLDPGWVIPVGFANYAKLFTDPTIRTHFLPITAWTFFFAAASTFLNFAVGLMLALVLAEKRMRGLGIYRLLLIVPYGLPGIMTILIWKGMLNTDFGLINQILGSNIGWLDEPGLARFSVLMVNLWMGFPYFFLVCSGALTAIPNDLKEAAYVDGASGRYAFRTVVLPLLLVATAPLLVTTFAFNFNNYNLIEMLTNGGPFPGSMSDGGSTDLLISYTLRIAFDPANQQLGLASAISMIIFVIVGTVSAYGFRLTRRLEDIRT